MLKYPDGSVRILVQGLRRIEVQQYVKQEPYYIAQVRHLTDIYESSKDLERCRPTWCTSSPSSSR